MDVNVVAAAKNTVTPLVVARVPNHVARAGSSKAFFDLVAAKAELAGEAQNMIGIAYLHHQLVDGAATSRGNRDYDRALVFYDPTMHPPRGVLIGAVKAFSALVPVVLDLATEPVVDGRVVPAASFRAVETKPLTIGAKAAEPYSFEIR